MSENGETKPPWNRTIKSVVAEAIDTTAAQVQQARVAFARRNSEDPTNDAVSSPVNRYDNIFFKIGQYKEGLRNVHNWTSWKALNLRVTGHQYAKLDEVAIGAACGYVTGVAIRKTIKFSVILLGAGFVSVQALQYYGLTTLQWGDIKNRAEKELNVRKQDLLNSTYTEQLVSRLRNTASWGAPYAGGFATGLIVGFRGKFLL